MVYCTQSSCIYLYTLYTDIWFFESLTYPRSEQNINQSQMKPFTSSCYQASKPRFACCPQIWFKTGSLKPAKALDIQWLTLYPTPKNLEYLDEVFLFDPLSNPIYPYISIYIHIFSIYIPYIYIFHIYIYPICHQLCHKVCQCYVFFLGDTHPRLPALLRRLWRSRRLVCEPGGTGCLNLRANY